jgi:hypothetical protein
METVTGLGAATWRVAPHSAFLLRKDDLRRVADAIASGSEDKQGDQALPSLVSLSFGAEKWCSS